MNIGCGDDIREGWENTDREEDWITMEREPGSVDAILLNHVAMYILPEEMTVLLRKWFSWLRPGGTIHIETQHLGRIRTPELLYGTGKHAGHRWGWTPEALGTLMEDAGFSRVVAIPGILHGWPDRDFLISGAKL